LIVPSRKNRDSYQFKVVLRDISPPIWRQFRVWGDATLAQLHRILQMVMGWENCHLYEFRIGGRIYGDPDLDDEWEIIDAKKTRVRNVLPGVGAEFEYEYDFGDDWQHDLLLEAVVQSGPDTLCPRCLAGERSCPPEDVGGSRGYADYLEALADPDHEEHDDMMAWRGPFAPEEFSVEKVNWEIEKKFRPVRKRAIRLPLPQPSDDMRSTPNAELLPQAILSKPVSLQTKRIRIEPNETVPLELNERERELILSRMHASGRNYVGIVKSLTAAHADLNRRDKLGRTALQYAVDEALDAPVRNLIDAHVDVNARDDRGRTPLSIAREGLKTACEGYKITAYRRIILLLQQAGATE
jgi:Plasmid pRiA4b ORF-3-like protein